MDSELENQRAQRKLEKQRIESELEKQRMNSDLEKLKMELMRMELNIKRAQLGSRAGSVEVEVGYYL